MIYGKVRFFFLVMVMSVIAALQTTLMEKSLFHLRDDYIKKAVASDAAQHEVVFSVKQRNLVALEKIFNEISNPSSASYGNYLTRQQVADLTSNTEATNTVVSFLLSHGVTITRKTKYGEYISARAPIGIWKNLFNTEFYEFEHVDTKKPVIRALEYSLPVDLTEHVAGVLDTVHFPLRKSSKLPATLATTRGDSITPALLNSYYSINSNTGNNLASQSVYEALEQYYSPADLSQFEKTYGIPSQAVAYDIGGYESDSECVDDPNNCIEANLDVEYLIAVSQTTPTTYYYDTTGSFTKWIQEVAEMDNPPLVHSISYGSIENELPKFIATQFNTEAQKLGVQGVTVIASSGDDGVANFQARSNPKKCGYNPSFPASSPYVTAVGATQGPESGTEEVACTSDGGGVITTGGGFSTVFTAPSYQTAIVNAYFKSLNASSQPPSGYAATGRGYPDVSLAGYNYEVVVGGKTYKVSGTSASSPVFAGFVSLVNAARLKAGKKPLGAVNQAIWQNAAKFSNDVTKGHNNCAASKVCCDEGFYAAAGWDPLTGFGSVNFQKFYDVFYNL